MAEENASGIGRYGLLAGVVVVVALVVGAAVLLQSGPSEPPRKVVPTLTTVKIMLPPPPPPPPPKDPPPPEPQKMVEAPKMQDVAKPDRPDPTPKPLNNAAPPGPLGLDAKGEGPGDAFGLSGHPGGGDLVGGGGGGSLAGWYGSVIGAALYQAVTKDGRLDHAQGEIRARIWLGPDGVPTRVELTTSLGDPKLDKAFEDIVLHQLRPSDPPPKELPQPVVIRLRAHATSRG